MMNTAESIGALANIPKDVPSPEAMPQQPIQTENMAEGGIELAGSEFGINDLIAAMQANGRTMSFGAVFDQIETIRNPDLQKRLEDELLQLLEPM